jgi:uncharacterized damage-inducible protein DinB
MSSAILTCPRLNRTWIENSLPTKLHAGALAVLWHVMIHEMRHTAQIAVLPRMQGIKQPSLDLLFYLQAG